MCDERERLIGYVYDECGDEERGLVDQHLETCETCRDEISGLRATRQDLLAWEVPDHGSVWKPFVPARLMPWYREVPAWAMAAAAGIMVVLGFSGGVAGQAFATREVTATPRTIVSVPADEAAKRAELAALEARIVDLMRADLTRLDQRVQAVSLRSAATPASFASVSDTGRDMAFYTSVNYDIGGLNDKLKALSSRLSQIEARMVSTEPGGSGLIR